MSRSAKDERDYVENLRREEPIKTEVIVELRAQNAALWGYQVRLLEALIEAGDALRVYREGALKTARRAVGDQGHCAVGCTRHEWHGKDGWHRVEK